jgi:hypothetical protein
VLCVEQLLDLVTGYNGLGHPSSYKPEVGKALKARWQQFLRDNEKDVRGGNQWRHDALGFPASQLFPEYRFFGNEPKIGRAGPSFSPGS